jgi:SAM-dependent methyltransferase
MKPKEGKSPLTGSTNIELKLTIKTDFLINEWKKSNIDVARFFLGLDEICLYECLDTGFKFFYPQNLEGDSRFYEDLQKFSWYYMPWKWEYEEALKLIRPDFSVLEIGCGPGDFLKKLKEKNIKNLGLEFNDEAVKKCREKELAVYQETIQKHAQNNIEKYDLVCSFQVMEHIAEIKEAVSASLRTLKPGGLLVISVPNDDSFIRKDPLNLMETPPHHMSRWNGKTLKSLEKIFDIKLQKIHIEPLQDYHYRYYYRAMFGNKIDKIFGPLGNYINLILGRTSLFLMVHTNLPKKIKGHSVMAVYQKDKTLV